MNTTQTITTRVQTIIADQLGKEVSEITSEKTITVDLGADSLDTMELVMSLEDEFEIEIPDDEAEKAIQANVSTVQTVIDYILSKVKHD